MRLADLPGVSGNLPFTRHELAQAFAHAGYARGAEVGVERGEFSERLCQSVPGLQLLCIDAWQAYHGYRDHVGQDKLDGFYRDTLARLAPYGAVVRRGWSIEVAATVPDASLDFVYLDANHSFASVVADIAAWAPKVRRGGVVAGHDYGRRSVGRVAEAVEGWTNAHDIAPWFVLTGDRSPSWMWRA